MTVLTRPYLRADNVACFSVSRLRQENRQTSLWELFDPKPGLTTVAEDCRQVYRKRMIIKTNRIRGLDPTYSGALTRRKT